MSAGSGPPAGGRLTEPGAPRGVGAPDVGGQRAQDLVPGAAQAAQGASAPRLNLNLPPSRAGDFSTSGPKGVLQLMPRPPETKSKLASDIEKAVRPDCAKAYAAAGLLAVVPLAVDAVRDKGCRW